MVMVKASELRIGNIVSRKTYRTEYITLTAEQIYSWAEFEKTPMPLILIGGLEPIPLTDTHPSSNFSQADFSHYKK
jgi:hypothetical protein